MVLTLRNRQFLVLAIIAIAAFFMLLTWMVLTTSHQIHSWQGLSATPTIIYPYN